MKIIYEKEKGYAKNFRYEEDDYELKPNEKEDSESDIIREKKDIQLLNDATVIKSQKCEQINIQIKELLLDADSLSIRHRDQTDNNESTSLTKVEYLALLNYKKDLRELSALSNDPDKIVFPLKPAFIN